MIPSALRDMLLNCYPRWSPTMYRLTLGAALTAALAVPLALVALPFVEFFNGMAAQPKGKTQMTYGRAQGADLMTERPPVEGTIPRGYFPYEFNHLENTIVAAQEVGRELANPLPLSVENLQRGRELYDIYCIACHGKTGDGDGSVVGPERYPAPPSLHTKQAAGYADGTVFHIVTKGLGQMPSYAEQFAPEERWLVAHYLRALRRAQAPQPEDLAP